MLNVQCSVGVLLGAIKRQFQIRKMRNLRLILLGLDDEPEEEPPIFDLVDPSGRPKKLFLHTNEPATKLLTGRQTYYVASVKSMRSLGFSPYDVQKSTIQIITFLGLKGNWRMIPLFTWIPNYPCHLIRPRYIIKKKRRTHSLQIQWNFSKRE